MGIGLQRTAPHSVRAWCALVLGVLVWTAVDAQSPAPLPQPVLQLLADGQIFAAARAPDGSVVIGGNFTAINGTTRLNIARLQANGALDPNWNPEANGLVQALAVDVSGAVYAGGSFGRIGGQPRRLIAKLSGTGVGAADANWNPGADSAVLALALDSSGAVYAGGYFAIIGGQPHSYIAKLAGDTGGADNNWNPAANDAVFALAVDSSGAVYAGGRFSSIGAQSRIGIAKLASDTGTADLNWNPGAAGDVVVEALAAGSGAIYASGLFSAIGGQPRSNIAKLALGTGAADPIWNPAADRPVTALAANGIDTVYAGGYFTHIGGGSSSHIAKLSDSGAGAVDPNWNPGADGQVSALALDGNGDAVAGGYFVGVGGQTRRGLAVVSSSGLPLAAVDTERPGVVYALAAQPDGGMIVGGDFYGTDQQLRNNLLRVLPGGTLDFAWNPGADSIVQALAVDSTGAVYAGGYFANIGGLPRSSIAKLAGSGTGAADPNWNPGVVGGILALAVDSTDAVYAGGSFFNIDGQPRSDIARLQPDGTLDAAWNPLGADNSVFALALDNSGALYAGGYFQNVGGQPRADIAKLSGAAGAVDPAWNPGADSSVRGLAVDASGAVYAGGSFGTIGGQTRSHIAKLTATTGAVDLVWNPGADGIVGALAVDSIGTLYAGGSFNSIGAQPRNFIAKLSGSGTGAVDAIWNPGSDNTLLVLALDSSGVLYAGGNFTVIGGNSRNGLAAFTTDVSDEIFKNGFE